MDTLHDETPATQFSRVNMILSYGVIFFVTFAGLPFVFYALYCGDNKDYDLYGKLSKAYRNFELYFALFGSVLSILLLVALWMNAEALHNELEHGDFFETNPSCKHNTDISGSDYPHDAVTGLTFTSVALYGAAIIWAVVMAY